MYLVAALIIAALIIGLGTIYNYARLSKEDKNVLGLSREIDYETSRVIDRGVFKGEDINKQVENITEYYANLNPRNELVTVFGDVNQLTAYHYKLNNEGTICIQTGSCTGIEFFSKVRDNVQVIQDNNNLKVSLEQGDVYEFELKPGKNFYIVLIKEKENEIFVAAPETK